MPDSPRWFLAHATPDREWAERLKQALDACGMPTWMATTDLDAGEDWTEEIRAAQKRSKGTLVLSSADGDAAIYFKSEVVSAIALRKKGGHEVVPVRIDDTDLCYGLDPLNALDLRALGFAGIAAKLARRAKVDTRLVRGTGARVVVVVHGPELGKAAEAVVESFKNEPGVANLALVDIADATSADEIDTADLRLVLVGYGTAGPAGGQRLSAALRAPERAIAVAWRSPDTRAEQAYKADRGRADELRALCPAQYTQPHEAARILRPAVEAWLRAHTGSQSGLDAGEQDYLNAGMRLWEVGKAGALGRYGAGEVQLKREALYVSLHVDGLHRLEDGRLVPASELEALRGTEPEDERQLLLGRHKRDKLPPPALLDELFAATPGPLLIEGEAGMGKSVFLEHVAWTLGTVLRGAPAPDAAAFKPSDLRGQTCPLPVPLPLLFQAVDLDTRIQQAGSVNAMLHGVADALKVDMKAARRALDDGRYVVLVDSLDEVPQPPDRADARTVVAAALSTFADAFPATRLVLTTRPYAHTQATFGDGWTRASIAPLDDATRARLVERWSTAQGLTPTQREELDHDLSAMQLAEDPGGRDPTTNPLLLTCVLVVWKVRKKLPDDLADLYDALVGILTERRADGGLSDSQRRTALQVLAWTMQEVGRQAVDFDVLADALFTHGAATDRRAGWDLLDRLHQTTGILRVTSGEGGRAGRMWHRSFQEFLAASFVASRATEGVKVAIGTLHAQGRLTDASWQGCLRFLVGAFGNQSGPMAQAAVAELAALARAALDMPDEAGLWSLVVEGLAEHRARCFSEGALASALAGEAARRVTACQRVWPMVERLRVLDALGRLGDPRLVDARHDTTDWVPFGPWDGTVGGDKKAFQSLPATEIRVPRIWVRRFPVTVGEYRRFVEDRDVSDDGLWDEIPAEERLRAPMDWPSQRRFDNRPVTTVTWWQARAFCRWAQQRWRLPVEGGTLDLPTSLEREAIGRGDGGGSWPWGGDPVQDGDDARARGGWGWPGVLRVGAAPVGAFPRGHRTDGLWDLAGNVYEWTASTFGDDVESVTSIVDRSPRGGSRVLRGGSWIHQAPDDLRCADRPGSGPGNRRDLIGFRVVCRGSPSRPD